MSFTIAVVMAVLFHVLFEVVVSIRLGGSVRHIAKRSGRYVAFLQGDRERAHPKMIGRNTFFALCAMRTCLAVFTAYLFVVLFSRAVTGEN